MRNFFRYQSLWYSYMGWLISTSPSDSLWCCQHTKFWRRKPDISNCSSSLYVAIGQRKGKILKLSGWTGTLRLSVAMSTILFLKKKNS